MALSLATFGLPWAVWYAMKALSSARGKRKPAPTPELAHAGANGHAFDGAAPGRNGNGATHDHANGNPSPTDEPGTLVERG